MILFVLLIPIALYYLFLKVVLKNYDETNRRFKKRTLFILLLTLPFWDHIVGYAYYKYLCFTQGGLEIYKTVTDIQEQKDYWFTDYYTQHPVTTVSRYGVDKRLLPSKDFSERQYVNINYCKFNYSGPDAWRYAEYDCTKADEYFKKNKIKAYQPSRLDKHIIKVYDLFDKNKFKSSLRITTVINGDKLETGYLNYCNEAYNSLNSNDSNYKYSCTYSDTLIKKYKLDNVVKVPKNPYFLSRNMDKSMTPIIRYVVKDEETVVNKETKEILGKSTRYKFLGGLYINLIGIYLFPQFSIKCHKSTFYSLEKIIIPYPYQN